MKAGHFPDNLLNYEETPGASETINKWVDMGHEVFIITGRPFNSYEPSSTGLMNTSLKECLYIVWINMGVKIVSRIMFII